MNPKFLEWLFPRLCVHCRADAPGFQAPPLCPSCRAKLTGPSLPPPQAAVIENWSAAFDFDGPIRKVIHQFKFRNRDYLGQWLGREMAARLSKPEGEDLALVPVPTSFIRWMGRGFNPAELLAREIGRAWEAPVRADLLVRKAMSRPQAALTRAQRKTNAVQIFLARPRPRTPRIAVLIDDVLTTGATIEACASSLLGVGVQQVFVRCAAYESSKKADSQYLYEGMSNF